MSRDFDRRLARIRERIKERASPGEERLKQIRAMTDGELHAAICAAHAEDIRLELEVAQVAPHPAIAALLLRLDDGSASDDDMGMLVDAETLFTGQFPDLATITKRFAACLQ